MPAHDFDEPTRGDHLNSLTNTIGRQVMIHCDTVTFPGVDLQTQEIQYGSAPGFNQVTSHGFAGNIVATFYADKYLREDSTLNNGRNLQLIRYHTRQTTMITM